MAAVIISTDKTQLTQFSGSKQAYPVYLTLGNIPNRLRRKPSEQACILIGYLPINKLTRGTLSKQGVSARYRQVFHKAMSILLEPLKKAGSTGVEMTGGDGEVRKVFPILAAYVADYPEQCLVTCSKYGSCPKCTAGPDKLDEATIFPHRSPFPQRTHNSTLSALAEAKTNSENKTTFANACSAAQISGAVEQPFWKGMPYANIQLSQTPDVLHQLYQGVLKHPDMDTNANPDASG